VNGGLVIFVADDPGMHSSQNEQDTRMLGRLQRCQYWSLLIARNARISPRSLPNSEASTTPVIVRLTTRVSHSQGLVSWVSARAMNSSLMLRIGQVCHDACHGPKAPCVCRRKNAEALELSETSDLNRIEWGDRKIGVITAESTISMPVRPSEMFPISSWLGLSPSEKLIKEFAAGVEKLYVIEELEPFIEDHCKRMGLTSLARMCFHGGRV
jgi:indolepyruvate ferredoxin oxidoreductase alpha subunit